MRNKGVNINAIIDSMAVPEGVTLRSNCPVCGHNNSFSVTANSGYFLYHCFYADCSISGKIKKGLQLNTVQHKKSINLSLYRTFFVPLARSPEAIDYIRKNNIEHAYSQKLANLEYDVRENRVVFFVYHKNMTIVDAVGRSLKNKKPKWKRYGASRVPFVTNNKSKTCVVVEDCASACAVTKAGVVGVSLMGTNLIKEYIPYLTKFDRAVIALDKDASIKTLTIAKELYTHMTVHTLMIDTDIKTWTTDQISERFREYHA